MKITQPYCHPGCYWLQPWLPCSALPCSALPCSTLPCSTLPCSALPCSTTVVATLFRKLARRLHPSPQPSPSLKDSLFLPPPPPVLDFFFFFEGFLFDFWIFYKSLQLIFSWALGAFRGRLLL